jgi:hypothetical protein
LLARRAISVQMRFKSHVMKTLRGCNGKVSKMTPGWIPEATPKMEKFYGGAKMSSRKQHFVNSLGGGQAVDRPPFQQPGGGAGC